MFVGWWNNITPTGISLLLFFTLLTETWSGVMNILYSPSLKTTSVLSAPLRRKNKNLTLILLRWTWWTEQQWCPPPNKTPVFLCRANQTHHQPKRLFVDGSLRGIRSSSNERRGCSVIIIPLTPGDPRGLQQRGPRYRTGGSFHGAARSKMDLSFLKQSHGRAVNERADYIRRRSSGWEKCFFSRKTERKCTWRRSQYLSPPSLNFLPDLNSSIGKTRLLENLN